MEFRQQATPTVAAPDAAVAVPAGPTVVAVNVTLAPAQASTPTYFGVPVPDTLLGVLIGAALTAAFTLVNARLTARWQREAKVAELAQAHANQTALARDQQAFQERLAAQAQQHELAMASEANRAAERLARLSSARARRAERVHQILEDVGAVVTVATRLSNIESPDPAEVKALWSQLNEATEKLDSPRSVDLASPALSGVFGSFMQSVFTLVQEPAGAPSVDGLPDALAKFLADRVPFYGFMHATGEFLSALDAYVDGETPQTGATSSEPPTTPPH